MKIKLNEMFISIQGESSWTGFPFFFIRTSGCNLNCSYCDTKYAKNKGYFLEIGKIIDEVLKSKINKVLITGGEPLIQKSVYILINELLKKNLDVFVETNGSILIDKLDENVIKILDIKTPSSDECDKNNYNNLQFLTEKDEVKFVIGDYNDFLWSIDTVKKFNIEKKVKNILLSPVFGKLNPKNLAEWIIEKRINWARIQVQLHKLIGLR